MEVQNYSVVFDPFTERNYIKSFSKKYKTAWEKTEQDIAEVCKRIDTMLEYSRADLISINLHYKLVKLDFAVEGTHISPKSSGNRCILSVDEDIRRVTVLLVYSKNDIGQPNETQKWQTVIKSQYPKIWALLHPKPVA
jgi:hypothetical protein